MLSLSMIVRDEEARLGECLRSVQGFADEMVAVSYTHLRAHET